MENFGKNLKNALIWKGITQTKLAEILSIHKTAVTEWITGRTYPTLEKFYKICLILDETPNYFLGFKD